MRRPKESSSISKHRGAGATCISTQITPTSTSRVPEMTRSISLTSPSWRSWAGALPRRMQGPLESRATRHLRAEPERIVPVGDRYGPERHHPDRRAFVRPRDDRRRKTLYVADSLAGAIHVVDVNGHKVTGSVTLDRTPSGVVIDDSPGQRTGVGGVSHHPRRTRVPAFSATADHSFVPED